MGGARGEMGAAGCWCRSLDLNSYLPLQTSMLMQPVQLEAASDALNLFREIGDRAGIARSLRCIIGAHQAEG